MKKGITQKEIARQLGISQALVSRALGGTAGAIDASPVTVEKIRRAAAHLNYSPNAAALTLKGAPSRTLGVIVKNFDDPFFGHMIGVLQTLARRQHYALLLVGWEQGNSASSEEMMLRKYQPDALIVCGSDYCPPAAQAFLDAGKPVVQIGLGKVVRGVRQVAVDEVAGMKELVGFLVEKGHLRIGYVGDASVPQLRRENCLRATVKDKSLMVRPEWFVRLGESSDRAVKEAMDHLMEQGMRHVPSALIAADDVMAQRVMRALYDRGIRVPEEISLAGIDDIPAAKMMIPALTSIHQPVEEMVRQAFQWVTGVRGKENGVMVVAPSLVIRESCGPVRAGDDNRRTI
jgi:LacI family transcriptional regulator